MKRVLILLFVFSIFYLVLIAHNNAKGDSQYVGSETCKGCHDESYASYAKSIHAKKAISGSPANREGCESCHGPGAQHAEKGGGRGVAIFSFDKTIDSKEKSAKCLACHENDRPLTFWDSGKHKNNDVACTNCHSIHKKEIYAKEYELCTKCHRDIKVQINKRSRHPILEDKVKCSSCHNQHGSMGPSMVRADSVNQLCYKCHAEKRGPYLWEHPPVEENCVTCHAPHGSRHAKLMVEKIPNLCQSCHDWQRHPGTRYDSTSAFAGLSPSNRFFARSCVNCHNAIHGSNAPANPASGYNSGKSLVR